MSLPEKSLDELKNELDAKMIEAYKAERKASFHRMVADQLHQEIGKLELQIKAAQEKGEN